MNGFSAGKGTEASLFIRVTGVKTWCGGLFMPKFGEKWFK